MVGAIWKPLAPAPTSAKRLPVQSTSGSQRAEWNDGPAKSSMPGMSGSLGWLSAPTALITNAGVEHLGGAVGRADRDGPAAGRLVVVAASDLGAEPAVRSDVVVVEHPGEVLLQLRLLGEVLAPVVGGLEGVAVEVAADVDAGARVAVVPPGAAGARRSSRRW